MKVENIFSGAEELFAGQNEVFETLLKSDSVRIERIISTGQASPEGFWYDQDENEWVLLLEGEAGVLVENELKILTKGDFLSLPAHARHRVEYTQNRTIWLAIFYK